MRMLSLRLTLLTAAVLSCAVVVRAQNPFEAAEDPPAAGDNPFAPAEPAAGGNPFAPADAPAAGNPFAPDAGAAPAMDAAPAPAAEPDATGEAAEPAPRVPNDPAVQAVLESTPQTPFELLRAIRILTDLGYPKLAQPFADQLTAQQISDEEKAALFRKFPPGMLMRVARDKEIGPKVAPFIDQLFAAADAMGRDQKRLADWAKLLGDPSEAVRAQATVALIRAQDAAVAPLVSILADPARENEHRQVKRALVRLSNAAVPPLVAVLESDDAALKSQVVEVLGAMQAEDAVAALLVPLVSPEGGPQLRGMAAAALANISGYAPDSATALSLLDRAARRQLALSRDPSGDGRPTVEVWHWDDELKQSVPELYNQTGAHLAAAVRLAAHLHELDPQSAERRRLYLIALLQAAKLGGGLDNPLPAGDGTPYAQAEEFGARALEDALAGAMAEGYIPAATAAAQILGDIGSLDLLAHAGATPGTLVRAAHHGDRRLRFAATEAIMKLKPREPFAGSSYVTEALGYFASSYGVPRLLVAHPLSSEAAKLAGLAATMGYDADTSTTGRQAYEAAVASPDYEVMLIHSAINRPAVDELLAQLRRDARTAKLPVGIMAPLDDLERIQNFTRRAREPQAFLQPQNEAEMKLFVGDLLAGSGRSHVPVAKRREQALAALDWLVELSQSEQRVFELAQLEPMIVPLMYQSETAGKAIELLAEIGSERSQEALVALADSPAQPLATRQAAVTALARSIRQYGTLLTTDEIRIQYDLYNDNAGRNRESHEVLGALLDVLEYQGDPPPTTAASSP